MDKRAEGVKRMEMLGILPQVVKEFENGVLNLSEYMNKMFPAVLYWVTNNSYNTGYSLVEKIKEFEEEYDALVYHVQLSHTEFGELYSFLYVSNWPEEWERDREMLKDGMTYAYVWNATNPLCSEFGSIGLEPSMGGVERTW